jgi:uncharacterized protein YajQ (UPF0234 family)
MPSFDIVSEVNAAELRNAVDQANKEIGNRFDFKGTDARVELSEQTLALHADDEFKLGQVYDILLAKLARRGIDIRCLARQKIEKTGGDRVRQTVVARAGVEQELAKKIQRLVKDSRLKVQAAIQGDAVRISGAKKDDLQTVIALVRNAVNDYPLQFMNLRD